MACGRISFTTQVSESTLNQSIKSNISHNIGLIILNLAQVPDQLVVLDPNLAAVDDQYVRVLQRYKVRRIID